MTDTDNATSTARKVRRKVFFTEPQWAKLERQAAKEGLSVPELLRRIVDLHDARDARDKALIARMVAIEARMARLEERGMDALTQESVPSV